MTEQLKNTVKVPNWMIVLFCSTIITVFATGWIKMDKLTEDLTVEKTSRGYIEKSLLRIEKKLDDIDKRIKPMVK